MAHEAGERETSRGIRATWARSDRALPRLIRPLQQFLDTEASSGALLLAAAIVALAWANIAGGSYEAVWGRVLTFGVGDNALSGDLRHWINHGAMSVFFFVVGLEIKREFVSQDMREFKAAIFPIAGAVGGMITPALVYASITWGHAGARGWGIPMATDIAFAVGMVALVAPRLPQGMRTFLLTLAIADDIGVIVVIAAFYSHGISTPYLATAAGLLLLMVVLLRIHVRAAGVHLALAIGVWLAVYESGVHATIAGILLALVTPAVAFQRPRAVSDEARRIADATSDDPSPPDADVSKWMYLARLSRDATPPLARMQHALHPWTSFVIVPLFALANSGVRFEGFRWGRPTSRIWLAVAAGLALGKLAGISLGSIAAMRFGGSRLPHGARVRDLAGIASIGGIGFTVSLFVASLAFDDAASLAAAKVGILLGSVVSGVAGALILRRSRTG